MCYSLSNIISIINLNICMGWACSTNEGDVNKIVVLISGFHRALLQSITFISPLNALDYTKLRG